MEDLNVVTLIGRLVRDPELKATKTGTNKTDFTIAVNGFKDQVSFINCTAWTKTAEIINQYSKKGDRIGIEGKINQTNYTAQDGTKKSFFSVNVRSVYFLTPKSEGNQEKKQEQPDLMSDEPVNQDNFDEQFDMEDMF